ncbi:MAG: hypothetical protein LBI38_00390 [Oscillospiraceae bacterium]|jgi:cell division septum initiation protein DivIVA|nr:hypothetical protein [Oscillospiraceae bacterium]
MAEKQQKQSAQSGVFKTVPMGFDKREVNLYIKDLIKKKDEEAEERISKEILKHQNSSGGGDGSGKIAELTKELEAAREKCSKLETRCSNMQTNLDRVSDELEKAKSQGGGGGGGGGAKTVKAAKAEADKIINDAKSQAAEIIGNAKKKSKSAKSGAGGGNPESFKTVIAKLDEGKKQLDGAYFAISALFEAAAAAAKSGADSAGAASVSESYAEPAVAANVPEKSDEFGEFADFAVGDSANVSSSGGMSDEFSEFADFAVDDSANASSSGGMSDEFSEFADLAIDGDSAGGDEFSEFAAFTVDGDSAEGETAPPLVKKDNTGEFSEEFQELMLSPTAKSVKGENLTEKDVVKTQDKGADLDESLFEMMLSHDVGALKATRNDDGGFSISGAGGTFRNAGDVTLDAPPKRTSRPPAAASEKTIVGIPPDPQDLMWNFDIDEDAEEDEDMVSDNIEISDLLM